MALFTSEGGDDQLDARIKGEVTIREEGYPLPEAFIGHWTARHSPQDLLTARQCRCMHNHNSKRPCRFMAGSDRMWWLTNGQFAIRGHGEKVIRRRKGINFSIKTSLVPYNRDFLNDSVHLFVIFDSCNGLKRSPARVLP